MWCDNFDMDLPKMVPDAMKAIEPLADAILFTYGNLTDGKLNHPSVWNTYSGMSAFFSVGGASKPNAYYTADLPVRCTWAEACRDAWCHDYNIVFYAPPVVPVGLILYPGPKVMPLFTDLMYDHRGWRHPHADTVTAIKARVTSIFRLATIKLQAQLDICRDLVAPGPKE